MISLALVKAQATTFIAEVPLLKHRQSCSLWAQCRALSSPGCTKYLYSAEMPKRKKKNQKPHNNLWLLYPEATLVISEYCRSKDSFTPQSLTLHNVSLFSLYVKDAQKMQMWRIGRSYSTITSLDDKNSKHNTNWNLYNAE